MMMISASFDDAYARRPYYIFSLLFSFLLLFVYADKAAAGFFMRYGVRCGFARDAVMMP